MRFLIHLLLLILVALGLGFGLSWYAITDGRWFGATQIGPWSAWTRAGLPSPDPYTRAYAARTGALELGAAEGLRFSAGTDSAGQLLSRNCTYRVEGTTPVSTFWTLVPVAGDGSLIAPTGGQTHFQSARISRESDGRLVVYVGKTVHPMDWVEITGEGSFELVLSLYDTTALSGNLGPAVLPAIVREACL